MKTTILSQRAERDKLLSEKYEKRYLLDTAILYRDSHPIIRRPRVLGPCDYDELWVPENVVQ